MRPASVLLSAACLAGSVFLASVDGCTPNQGVGERCDTVDDCQSGLSCVSSLCCEPGNCSTSTITDSGTNETKPDTNPPPDTNVSADAIGTACTRKSDCPVGLVCLPGGKCGLECVGNRDCNAGQHCDCPTFSCQAGTTGGADDCTDAGTTDSGTGADTTVGDSGTDTTVDDTADAAETD